jgi:hypothetical protein
LLDKANYRKFNDLKISDNFFFASLNKLQDLEGSYFWSPRKKIQIEPYKIFSFIPLKLLHWPSIINYPESFWYSANRVIKGRRKKVYFTKCSNRTLTLSG